MRFPSQLKFLYCSTAVIIFMAGGGLVAETNAAKNVFTSLLGALSGKTTTRKPLITTAAAAATVQTTTSKQAILNQISSTVVVPTLVPNGVAETTRNIIISFPTQDCSYVLDNIRNNASLKSLEQRSNAWFIDAQLCAATVMSSVLTFIQSVNNVAIQEIYMTSEIIINNAPQPLIDAINQNFPSLVSIRDQIVYTLPIINSIGINFPVTTLGCQPLPEDQVPWGIKKVSARQSGANGTGIVVATIDTGVMAAHCALKDNFRKEAGWFDATNASLIIPYDDNGHGTHTMGTLAGGMGIGVAPGAKWITCKGCGSQTCDEGALKLCGQWLACPNGKGSLAPHLISNSWAGDPLDTSFNSVIDTWKAIGIIPVFAIGNSGSSCGSTASPGNYDQVIAVGSTTVNDTMSTFSSRGPSYNPGNVVNASVVKPDVSAPGDMVLSAFSQDVAGYVMDSGTSMATPHAAGLVALMLSKNNTLTYDQVRQLLIDGCMHANDQGQDCGPAGRTAATDANNVDGYGLVNAVRSIQYM